MNPKKYDHKPTRDAERFMADKNYKKRARLTLPMVLKAYQKAGGEISQKNITDCVDLVRRSKGV